MADLSLNKIAGKSMPTLAARPPSTYTAILDSFGLSYKHSEYYWQIGKPHSTRDWILNLTVVKRQLPELLELLIPVITSFGFPFRVICDESLAEFALNGHLGPVFLGKMISIYPPTPQDAQKIAKTLIPLTKSFKGPVIRTDRCLGGIVYTSYGAHTTIPFSIPPRINWPFTEIVAAQPPSKSKLLNFLYYPTSIIKGDAKGDVIKALYFKQFLKIQQCVIKQGRQNMFMDDSGRDIRDRLQWQFKLHMQLAAELPMPKIIDHFSNEGDSYIALQWINGISFTYRLNKLYQNRVWYELSDIERLEIIDHLLNILSIVKNLHEKGYIHRDITPENFLLDKNNKIWMIDLELMWSVNSRQPTPPFSLGTPGFISPEQRAGRTPTVKEDIYALGAILIAFFTNLGPVKFQQRSGIALKRNIFFFVQNDSIASLINACIESHPTERPSLAAIIDAVTSFRKKIEKSTYRIPHLTPQPYYQLDEKHIRKTIQLALNGLALPSALDPDNHWISRMPVESNVVGNEQLGMTVQEGWYRGTAGPLWLLAIAHRHGFNISKCRVAYEQNWNYIRHKYFESQNSNKSFYEGRPGISMALVEGMNSALLPKDAYHIQCLKNCFSNDIVLPTLAEGIAGNGIALLYASPWLDADYIDKLLSHHINILMSTQKADGAWPLPKIGGWLNKNIYTLNHGMAGIIWFLLSSLEANRSLEIELNTTKALDWLLKKISKNGKLHAWRGSKQNALWSSENGNPGLALLFLKAYKVLNIQTYREIAEAIMLAIPQYPVINNFTLGSGLAGLGELYIDAYRELKAPIWLSRTEWIAQLLMHTLHIESEDDAAWLPDSQSDFTADLFMGNSGIIHFLLRYIMPDKINHPFDPLHQIHHCKILRNQGKTENL